MRLDIPLQIAQCSKCGHVYQCPQIDKSYGSEYYDAVYHGECEDNAYWKPENKLRHAEVLLATLTKQCPNAKTVLEIGSGMGAFMHVAQNHGLEVVGTEISEAGVLKAKEAFGIDLFCGPVEELEETEPFDVVVMWDVIEHCPRPDQVIANVLERLSPSGKLLLTTGNYQSKDRIHSGEDWWCWDFDHYHYFHPATIERLALNQGYREVKTERVERIRSAEKLQRKKSPPPKNPWRHFNPLHLGRAIRWNCREMYAKSQWPDHYDIGIMLCSISK
ncbi:class I SAM-dependent methyltransferase [Symmachiella dynata]|uniref:Bifunctional 3-demethylubiquinone-9 3-methyltransferase/ 2-octaprenyl-6-hydroxy phenol methylase n=1 Tax=Symmachiella dynata TaxID=2527995 RepID=A0A517ZHG9_9PLAN|nr:class I SAM-dependent methyltransferase [Symmachiella dynata]QDT46419.1 bifunctional 3-demethylubiquinone-9 3-methyltransferase/ 2-octaprenyl-6-hydroxy phenol methylase [Symmachiella dynata]QDU41920.1 bifunctional 3-demethylubiquinone-9 3-methyltransferase/ 2-octaprenyl-6-hydroxy phenol methylase [Symmachiella dynata]